MESAYLRPGIQSLPLPLHLVPSQQLALLGKKPAKRRAFFLTLGFTAHGSMNTKIIGHLSAEVQVQQRQEQVGIIAGSQHGSLYHIEARMQGR